MKTLYCLILILLSGFFSEAISQNKYGDLPLAGQQLVLDSIQVRVFENNAWRDSAFITYGYNDSLKPFERRYYVDYNDYRLNFYRNIYFYDNSWNITMDSIVRYRPNTDTAPAIVNKFNYYPSNKLAEKYTTFYKDSTDIILTKQLYGYDINDSLAEIIDYNWNKDSTNYIPVTRTTYDYDTLTNCVIKETRHKYLNGNYYPTYIINYFYWKNSNQLSKTMKGYVVGDTVRYEEMETYFYNPKNLLDSRITYYFQKNPDSTDMIVKRSYSYDSESRMVELSDSVFIFGKYEPKYVIKYFYGEYVKHIEEIAAESRGELEISPNPARTFINIKSVTVDYFISLSIYNELGERVLAFETGSPKSAAENIQIDIASLPAGVYYLLANTKAALYKDKFIVLK